MSVCVCVCVCVCVWCAPSVSVVLRLLWILAVAEPSVRIFQEHMTIGERETWRRHAASTGATPPIIDDVPRDSEARIDPTRPPIGCLDLGTPDRCT